MAVRLFVAGVIVCGCAFHAYATTNEVLLGAESTHAYHHLTEPNDLDLEDSGFVSNVSEEQFNAIIDAARKIYAPIAEQKGEHLYIFAHWESATVNANCLGFPGGNYNINMYGGLARRSEITPDGFALVLCHEIGHAFGGYPFMTPATAPKLPNTPAGTVFFPQQPISTEGQADYYGAGVCLKMLLLQLEPATEDNDEYIEHTCRTTAPSHLCARSLAAGKSVARLFAAIRKVTDIPSFTTPDKTVVPETNESHPSPQCRLDTFFAGTLALPRPGCWFKYCEWQPK